MNILVSACLLGVACRYDGKSKEVERIKKLLSKYNLIPICPEQLGGLPTPRVPSERCGDKVINSQMEDVTLQYKKGAEEALRLAKIFNCSIAILKAKRVHLVVVVKSMMVVFQKLSSLEMVLPQNYF